MSPVIFEYLSQVFLVFLKFKLFMFGPVVSYFYLISVSTDLLLALIHNQSFFNEAYLFVPLLNTFCLKTTCTMRTSTSELRVWNNQVVETEWNVLKQFYFDTIVFTQLNRATLSSVCLWPNRFTFHWQHMLMVPPNWVYCSREMLRFATFPTSRDGGFCTALAPQSYECFTITCITHSQRTWVKMMCNSFSPKYVCLGHSPKLCTILIINNNKFYFYCACPSTKTSSKSKHITAVYH